MKKSIALQSLAMMAMFSDSAMNFEKEETPKKFIPKQNTEPKIPTSLKHYWFKRDGTFLHENHERRMFKSDTFFTCFALNDKNAIRKFKKFMDSNSVPVA